jgi:hypothetical protein
MFRRNVLSPSSGPKCKLFKQAVTLMGTVRSSETSVNLHHTTRHNPCSLHQIYAGVLQCQFLFYTNLQAYILQSPERQAKKLYVTSITVWARSDLSEILCVTPRVTKKPIDEIISVLKIHSYIMKSIMQAKRFSRSTSMR